MFMFLLLTIMSCWTAAAAWIVDEETKVGVTAFDADITSMCGLEYDGISDIVSACSLVRCCSH